MVASLDESTGVLDVANVGDTGIRVIRKGEVVLTSTPKQHRFECPYQLASAAFAEVNDQFDSAADAECLSFAVQVCLLTVKVRCVNPIHSVFGDLVTADSVFIC